MPQVWENSLPKLQGVFRLAVQRLAEGKGRLRWLLEAQVRS